MAVIVELGFLGGRDALAGAAAAALAARPLTGTHRYPRPA